MKKILFLLLLTVSVYGQNPSRFAKIQITGNTTSGTATKVNVQEANGEVNTQTINSGFNKNIGLGGSDVVGANTLLNQYSTTPVDWTATTFDSGQVVFYGGKQWIAKIATVAGDMPSVSSKWEEITFESLANKTITVDAIPTDGSNNAVSSNGVFDALATKAPISGSTNYIQNQNTSAQSANMWINGDMRSNSGIYFYPSNSARALLRAEAGSGDFSIFQYNSGGSFLRTALSISNSTGAATFASTVSASPAVSPNQVVVKSQLDAVASSAGTSGTWSSNCFSADSKLTGITTKDSNYLKVGSIVNCSISGSFTGYTTSESYTDIQGVLPFNSTVIQPTYLGAAVIHIPATDEVIQAFIYTFGANGFRLRFKTPTGASKTGVFSVTFQYR